MRKLLKEIDSTTLDGEGALWFIINADWLQHWRATGSAPTGLAR